MNSVKADLPIKVNMAGVLPAIFAVSIILFPTIISRFFFTANIPQVRETAQSIESFLSSTPSSQGQTGFPLPGSPEASFAGFYTTNDPQELAVAKQNDYTVGQEIFGFTFSTNPEVKNSFFEGTFAEFEAPTAPRLGVLPETIIGWNGVLAYTFFYFILIIFFTYFYTSEIAFKTDEVAENLQKSGAYIPGQKPGEETANYLSYVSNRLNVAGSLFLAIIAVVPMMFSSMQIGDGTLTGVVGGTTLLILVSVSIEALKQIDAQATNVDYEKFSSY